MNIKNIIIIVCCLFSVMANCKTINPFPREIIDKKVEAEWTFDKDIKGWRAASDCSLSHKRGRLSAVFGDKDPYFYFPEVEVKGPVLVEFRARNKSKGGGQFYWGTSDFNSYAPERLANIPLICDGKYHNYSIELPVEGTMTKLRFDPSSCAGKMEIDWMRLTSLTYHPLEIIKVQILSGSKAGLPGLLINKIAATVTNHSEKPISFSFENKKYTIPGGKAIQSKEKFKAEKPFETVELILSKCKKNGKLEAYPTLKRPVRTINPDAESKWITLEDVPLKLKVAEDGTGALIFRNGNLVGTISPLAECKTGVSPVSWQDARATLNKIKFSGKEIGILTLELKGNEIHYHLEGRCPQHPKNLSENKAAGDGAPPSFEGPVVRVFGEIEQGLLAGVEYLGKNEKSSSKLDLITLEHVRYLPNKMWMTMPLMAFVTSNATIAVSYEDMNLQPTFATPNFFDGTKDSRMSLRGENIDATILVEDGWENGNRLENVIEWFVDKRGLPSLPPEPRTENEQMDLCKKAIEGGLKNSNGWGHCFGDRWERHNFSDYVSASWFLDSNFFTDKDIVMGGAHNQSFISFFLNGQAARWLAMIKGRAVNALKAQQPDGSFRFDGKFRKGHFENTASGYCAQKALALLDSAYYTGDKKALTAGVKTLEYMKRFRTPRGAQVWEIPLHTPDILASARIVRAYVKGYELTGKKEYLDLAKRWAITGIPFIYFWGNQPVMKYSTIAVLGATHWTAPNWIGLPVQWCGLVYADAILDLANYDNSYDWNKIAKGILIAGEQMQYTEDEVIGCLPDSFTLKTQSPNPHDIGPPAMIFLRNRLGGNYHSLHVKRNNNHLIISPFPCKLYKNKIVISAKPRLKYQIIIDGKVINIKSKGKDSIKL